MSNSRNTGFLTNVIKTDANGNISLVSGSTTLLYISASGAVITTGVISGSAAANATSASYASNAETLDGLDSTVFTLTSSFNTLSSSLSTTSGSFNTRVTALEVTGSALSSSILSVSASSYLTSGSLSSASGSFNSRVTTIESKYATTGSNTFRAPQYVSDTTVPSGFTNSTGSIYTDGGLLVAKDSYFSSSMFIKGNLTIYGTQSVAYITSSQLNIATNIITVNTATPAVRFGGLAVYDSGSTGTGATGSLLWDSQNNGWVYQRESGSTYAGGMLISGPRRALGSNLGDEQGLTACMIPVAQGGDHITSSMIYTDSTVTCIPTPIIGGSTACVAGTLYVNSTSLFNSDMFTYNNGGIFFSGGGAYTTGIFQNATGLQLQTGTSPRLTITNAGVACFAGSVCVAGEMAVRGNASAYNTHYFTTGASNVAKYIQYNASGTAINQIAADNVSYFNSGCNVGIGINNPSYRLDVNGCGRFIASGNNYILDLSNSGTNQYGGVALRGTCRSGELDFFDGTTVTAAIYSNNSVAKNLIFTTNGYVEALRINSDATYILTNTTYSTSADQNTITFNQTYPSSYNIAQIAVKTDGNYYAGAISFRTADSSNANLLVERLKISNYGIACFSNTICTPLVVANQLSTGNQPPRSSAALYAYDGKAPAFFQNGSQGSHMFGKTVTSVNNAPLTPLFVMCDMGGNTGIFAKVSILGTQATGATMYEDTGYAWYVYTGYTYRCSGYCIFNTVQPANSHSVGTLCWGGTAGSTPYLQYCAGQNGYTTELIDVKVVIRDSGNLYFCLNNISTG